jgi:PAS domain S-box-containing protein
MTNRRSSPQRQDETGTASDAAPVWHPLHVPLRRLRLRPPRLPAPLAFATSVGAVALATLLQYASLAEPVAPFLFFFPCVVVTAYVAGRLPGLLAVLLSALAGNYLFIPPYEGLALSQPVLVATAFFIVASAAVALLCASFRDAFLSLEQLSAEQKRAEEVLRRRETTLQQAGHMAHLGAWDIEVRNHDDLNVNRLSWSDEVYRIFGYEPGTVTVTSALFFERVHPDDRRRIADAIADSIATRRPYSIEHRIFRPDGEERIVHEHAELLFDEGGKLTRVIGAVQDVTERKRADRTLRENEQRMKRTQEIAHLGSWELDLVTNRLSWSDEVYRIFGLAPQEFGATYEAFLEAVHPDDRAAVDAAYSGSLREGKDRYEIEHRVVQRSNGEIRVVHEKCEHIRDEAGRIVRSVGMVHDITERKRAEAELFEADRRKNEFLAMLSHELRNPLAPIRNSLHILDRAAPGGEQARRAQAVIDRQVAHMTHLIDDLLDVTRVSRGKIELQMAPLELGELVRRTVEDHRSIFAKGGIELGATIPDRALWVNGDATRLAQVVGNLLQNAAKFTARGGRASVAIEKNGERAVIRIRDTGAGISAEMLPRLFVPFAQAPHTLDRTRGGLGLGLALVKGLVDLHGGRVEARSEGTGKGSHFSVWLPLRPAPRPAARAPVATAGTMRLRVLVIEDNVDAAESLREALELDHHEVDVAFDGPQGLEKARRVEPDVVLCDIGLPGMDGYEVARAFRADPALGSVYLVALSGYALPEDIAKAQAAGFDHHLAKPPTIEELEQVLSTRVSGPRSEDPASTAG